MRVASKVVNLPSKFGHARPLGSRIIRYVRDGQTDGRTDGQKQRLLPLPYGLGHNNVPKFRHDWLVLMLKYKKSHFYPLIILHNMGWTYVSLLLTAITDEHV